LTFSATRLLLNYWGGSKRVTASNSSVKMIVKAPARRIYLLPQYDKLPRITTGKKRIAERPTFFFFFGSGRGRGVVFGFHRASEQELWP
jgi:hypothetical protein